MEDLIKMKDKIKKYNEKVLGFEKMLIKQYDKKEESKE